MNAVHYNYLVNLKLIVGDELKLLQDEYPGATDINLASRGFYDYNECVTSCKQLMEDAKAKANAQTKDGVKYIINSEVNPAFTGTPTLSKDWSTGELARLWLFDEKMDGAGQIIAIGQARIFKTHGGIYSTVT